MFFHPFINPAIHPSIHLLILPCLSFILSLHSSPFLFYHPHAFTPLSFIHLLPHTFICSFIQLLSINIHSSPPYYLSLLTFTLLPFFPPLSRFPILIFFVSLYFFLSLLVLSSFPNFIFPISGPFYTPFGRIALTLAPFSLLPSLPPPSFLPFLLPL